MKGLYKIFALLFVVMLCGCSHSDDEAILKQKGELIISLNAPVEIGVEQTRAGLGNGNTFDGGGMEDLVLVLIDEGDRVVSKKTFTFNGSVWSSSDAIIDSNVENKSITTSFTDLDVAKYTVFAYANVNNSLPYFGDIKSKLDAVTVGGTFTLEDATFDDLGNAGSTTTPTVNSTHPMLLTARELVEIEVGANTAVVEMKRPLVEFNFKVVNHSSKQLNITNLKFKNFNPQTSYITPHDAIYAEDATNNIYRELPASGFSNTTPAVIDATEKEVIYKTYLYENTSATDRYQFDISLALPGAVVETTILKYNGLTAHNGTLAPGTPYVLKNTSGNYYLIDNGGQLSWVNDIDGTNFLNAEFTFSGQDSGYLTNMQTGKKFYCSTSASGSGDALTFNYRNNGVYRIYYSNSYLRINTYNSVVEYANSSSNRDWQLYVVSTTQETQTQTVDPLTASNQQISYIQDNGVAAPLKEMLRNQKITVTLNVYFEETSGTFRFYIEEWNDTNHNNGATFD